MGWLVVLVLVAGFTAAHTDDVLEHGREIVDADTPCSELSSEQLEAVGDYFMEQMHPGTAHERMDEMMGGEGSDSLRQAHISMAQNLYCDDEQGSGMMHGGAMMHRESFEQCTEDSCPHEDQRRWYSPSWSLYGWGFLLIAATSVGVVALRRKH